MSIATVWIIFCVSVGIAAMGWNPRQDRSR